MDCLWKKKRVNKIITLFWKQVNQYQNTRRGIKGVISMRSSSSITPILLTFQNETIDNPKRITNIFNNYFSTIGKNT